MTSSPRIHVSAVGVSMVVSIREPLTFQTCDELGKTVNEIISKNRNRIVLDFKGVSLLDSHALDLLVTLNERLTASGGSLKLFALNGVCRDILVATRLINLFHVYADLQEALRGDG
jgi:anti-anti-sigma factor